jgi:predicted lipoprotein with Yx(FWY)xxD motif
MTNTSALRLLAGLGATAIALAACGGSSAGGLYGSGNGGSSPASASRATASIDAATVQGVGRVLENSRGFTLYHRTTDTPGKSTCTGSCAASWPPVLADGGAAPSGMGLPGSLSTISRPDGGRQVTYNGMPLYTYSGDAAPGEANGQGIDNVWFAVTPNGSSSVGAAGSTGSSAGSGGGGYGGGRYGNGGGYGGGGNG